jgi:hypothetical protein
MSPIFDKKPELNKLHKPASKLVNDSYHDAKGLSYLCRLVESTLFFNPPYLHNNIPALNQSKLQPLIARKFPSSPDGLSSFNGLGGNDTKRNDGCHQLLGQHELCVACNMKNVCM